MSAVTKQEGRPSREEAEEAVRVLLRWAGENPEREGLLETPGRVVRAYAEMFSGYNQDPKKILEKTFGEADLYEDFVLLRSIPVESHCEHHILQIVGVAHVAYVPGGRVLGLSKIARLVEMYARRMQTQERMTIEIATALHEGVDARGVALLVDARHYCMGVRGVRQYPIRTTTTHRTGVMREPVWEERFHQALRQQS